MARYIAEGDIYELLQPTGMALIHVSQIDVLPRADVAPRAEVAREIFEEIEREITDALKSNYKVLPQVEESEALWNNVNGKINALGGIRYFIEELEKKYTEEQ